MNNDCEEIRSTLKKIVDRNGTFEFTNYKLAKSMKLFTSASSNKEIESATGKVNSELNRCRALDDNWELERERKFPKEKSNHAYMLDELGIKLTKVGLSPKYSSGRKKPAILWRVEPLNKVMKDVHVPTSSFKEQWVQSLPDSILIDEFNRRFINDTAA